MRDRDKNPRPCACDFSWQEIILAVSRRHRSPSGEEQSLLWNHPEDIVRAEGGTRIKNNFIPG